MGFLMPARLFFPLLLLMAGCGTSVRLDRPVDGSEPLWAQFGGDGSGQRREAGQAASPLRDRWTIELSAGSLPGGLVADRHCLYVARHRAGIEAYDRETGAEMGDVVLGGPVTASPVIAGGSLILPVQAARTHLVQISGLDLNQWELPTDRVEAPLVAGFSHILIATKRGQLLCYEEGDSLPRWERALTSPFEAAPALAEQRLAFASPELPEPPSIFTGGTNGDLHALTLDSGVVRWRYGAESPIVGHLSVRQGRVFAVTRDGRLLALDARDGRVLWCQAHGVPAHRGPALDDHAVYVIPSDGRVRAWNQEQGTLLWTSDSGSPPGAAPLRIGSCLIAGYLDGTLRVFNATTGALLDERHVRGRIHSLIALDDTTFCIATDADEAHAFTLTGGGS